MLPGVGVKSHIFNLSWVFEKEFKNNVRKIIIGPVLMKTASLLWCNAVEEINQQVFHNKASSWFDRYEFAHLNASSWHSLSKQFKDFSMQDILVNWQVFIFPLC